MWVALFIAGPILVIGLLGWLLRTVMGRMKTGELARGWGYFLSIVLLIPFFICAFILVFMIGAFTGVIPLM